MALPRKIKQPQAAVNCPACKFDVVQAATYGVDSRLFARSSHVMDRGRRSIRRVAGDVTIFEDNMLQRVAIAAHKAIPEVIKRQAKLSDAR